MRLLTRAFVDYVIEQVKRGPDISGHEIQRYRGGAGGTRLGNPESPGLGRSRVPAPVFFSENGER